MTPAYAELLAKREHGALIRGDDGNLHIRHFATAADASAASQDRELPTPTTSVTFTTRLRRREWRLADAAREIGVSAKTLRRYLPHIRHRAASPKITYIPGDEINLIKLHGLHRLRDQRLP